MSAAAAQQQFELLSRSFIDYKVCAQNPGSVNSKCQLASLTDKLQKQGMHGHNALQLLTHLKQQIGWQTMHQEEFRCFYQFVFFLCREQGKRNVQVPVAIAAWRGLLEGRFRLLDRWCTFMSSNYKPLVVTEDTWTQLLEFSRTVLEDLSNYDPTAAWPVALDDFVEHIRRSSAKKAPDAMDLTNSWPPPEQLLAAVSPRSGSKRRMPVQVAEVAQQLQQLPLGGTSPQQHQTAMAATAFSDRPRAGHHAVKRYKVAGHPPAPGAAPVKAAAPLGFRRPHQQHPAAAGGQREPFCEPFEELMVQTSPLQGGSQRTAACGLHPMAKSMSAGCGRPVGWGGVHSPQQQQQQQQCMTMEGLNNMGGGWSEMAVPVMQHGRQEAFRCSSVNALMQATVGDTLFFT